LWPSSVASYIIILLGQIKLGNSVFANSNVYSSGYKKCIKQSKEDWNTKAGNVSGWEAYTCSV
jgi:hypothetical protein